MIERTHIQQKLAQIKAPGSDEDLATMQVLQDVQWQGETLCIRLNFPYPIRSAMSQIAHSVEQALLTLPGVHRVEVQIHWQILARAKQANLPLIEGVKNVIAIASGKGGVGKSTIAANLACALQAEGASVGLLDGDIYGPSQPHMLGLAGQQPESPDGKRLSPLRAHGLQMMSMGCLIEDEATPMIWRGPMATSALKQLTFDTNWVDLDYLIIDLPPGTGDIQLTLAQKIPLSGVVIATTPQDIALIDVKKAVNMFAKVKVPILGVVENMAYYHCPKCQHEEAIFGTEGAEKLVDTFKLDILGSLPLSKYIRAHLDQGLPTVLAAPNSDEAQAFKQIAWRLGYALAKQQKDYTHKFPKIVVESDN